MRPIRFLAVPFLGLGLLLLFIDILVHFKLPLALILFCVLFCSWCGIAFACNSYTIIANRSEITISFGPLFTLLPPSFPTKTEVAKVAGFALGSTIQSGSSLSRASIGSEGLLGIVSTDGKFVPFLMLYVTKNCLEATKSELEQFYSLAT